MKCVVKLFVVSAQLKRHILTTSTKTMKKLAAQISTIKLLEVGPPEDCVRARLYMGLPVLGVSSWGGVLGVGCAGGRENVFFVSCDV